MRTELTKSNIKNGCSSSELKPALNGAFYEPDKGLLTCTDGHILISHTVETSDGDESGILPVDCFKTKKSQRSEYTTNGAINSTINGITAIYPYIDQKYPDYETVVPEHHSNSFKVGVNLKLLKRLCDSVPEIDGEKNVILDFNLDSNRKPIKFTQFADDNDNPKYSGVIMPVRIDE